MKFARMSGIFSLLSSYSDGENQLLAKENAITVFLHQNSWLANVSKAQAELKDFLALQMNNSVRVKDYGHVEVQLDSILQNLKNLALREPAFKNHHPDALIGEIQAHLANRRQARADPHRRNLARVISYKADLRNADAENFHAMMATRQRVLWTFDVDGFLSIGDPQGNKHSVVAAGKQVKGAGQAQLLIDGRSDAYYAARDQRDRAAQMRRDAVTALSDKLKKEFLENAKMMEEQATIYEESVGGWVPPATQTREVELDFDSGHYAPRDAWKASTGAWNEAGYKVVWSTSSRFV